MDTITLWTPITINLKASRDRINTPRLFNSKQRKVLHRMINLFEKGNLKDMVALGQGEETKALFEYSIWEYLEEQYYEVINNRSMGRVFKIEEIIKHMENKNDRP